VASSTVAKEVQKHTKAPVVVIPSPYNDEEINEAGKID
jgi:hypothetical protein